MGATEDPRQEALAGRFLTTRWSLVARAGGAEIEGRRALETLCESYWYPLYLFVRRRGYDVHVARDLTQGFFAKLLERRDWEVAEASKGRFRSFLLAALENYLANEWRAAGAQKRGGGQPLFSIDGAAEERIDLEDPTGGDPREDYERAWALSVLEAALARLRSHYERRGKAAMFDVLKGSITADGSDASQQSMADELKLTLGAVKQQSLRLRKRYREELLAEIAGTLADPEDAADELAELFRALG